MAIWRAASSVHACKCAQSDSAWEQGPQQVATVALQASQQHLLLSIRAPLVGFEQVPNKAD